MTEEKREGSWLFWIIAFLVIAFFVYVWLTRDEEKERDTRERAVNSLRDVEAKIDDMRHKAQSVINATEERIAQASANLAQDIQDAVQESQSPPPTPPAQATTPNPTDDDLTRIEGIGAKYRDALVQAGVTTFAQIASMTEEQLTQIVRDAGMRRPASITTWAEQAQLASKEDWDGLHALQEQLKGGRR